MDDLGALYHWSPGVRRRELLTEGLRPFARPVCHTGDMSYPYVCLAPTASGAWGLSVATLTDPWGDDFGGWDLWQVRLVDTDEVHVPQMFGPWIREVRVKGAIPADRLWYVGRRDPPSAEEAVP